MFLLLGTLICLCGTINAQTPNWLWAKSAGETGYDSGHSVVVDASGNVYLAGQFDSPPITFGSNILTNVGNLDVFLVKLQGSTAGINELGSPLNILVFLNPAKDKITIEISEETIRSNLTIVNIEGQEFITQLVTARKTIIDISNLPSGVYLLQLTNDGTVKVGKFFKQ